VRLFAVAGSSSGVHISTSTSWVEVSGRTPKAKKAPRADPMSEPARMTLGFRDAAAR
jgi:hypothetical protein